MGPGESFDIPDISPRPPARPDEGSSAHIHSGCGAPDEIAELAAPNSPTAQRIESSRRHCHPLIRVVSADEYEQAVADPASKRQSAGHFYSVTAFFTEDSFTLVVANRIPVLPEQIDRDDAWARRKELALHLRNLFDDSRLPALGLDSQNARIRLMLDVLTEGYRHSFENPPDRETVLELFFRNSQAKFDRVADELLSGARSYSLAEYASDGVFDEGYSHIEHFAWIYVKQIELIREVLRKNPERTVRVADLGCGGSNFILTAARALTPDELGRVEFIAVDLGGADVAVGNRMLAEIPAVNVRSVVHNVSDPGFINVLSAYEPNVIVVNHVLEHLPGDPDDYLHQWSVAARDALSVSVPIGDDVEQSISRHLHAFTPDSIRETVERLTERVNHTITCPDLDETSCGGLLQLRKDHAVLRTGGFGGEVFVLSPRETEVVLSPVYEDFGEPFNPERFKRAVRAPKVATVLDNAEFTRPGQPRQVRQLPIKMPGTDVIIPVEFVQFREAVQLIIDHNRAINPNFAASYVYLNVFRGITRHDSYRGLSLSNHGDQLQGLDPRYWYPPDYSYIVSSTLPTILYEQDFDMSEAIERFQRGDRSVNLYDYMNSQARPDRMYRTDNFGIYLLSPYIVHAAALAEQDIYRVFMKVAVSLKRFYDNREERRNPAFDYSDWYMQPTIGRVDGFLQHGHLNERFLKKDVVG